MSSIGLIKLVQSSNKELITNPVCTLLWLLDEQEMALLLILARGERGCFPYTFNFFFFFYLSAFLVAVNFKMANFYYFS